MNFQYILFVWVSIRVITIMYHMSSKDNPFTCSSLVRHRLRTIRLPRRRRRSHRMCLPMLPPTAPGRHHAAVGGDTQRSVGVAAESRDGPAQKQQRAQLRLDEPQ